MPDFSHRSLNAAGKLISGQVSAPSLSVAIENLIAEGLTPVDVARGRGDLWMKLNAPVEFFSRPTKRDVYGFTRDLARLTHAGLPLERALALTAGTAENKVFADIISTVQKSVRKGNSLANVLSAEQSYFEPFYVATIHSGEVSGQLPSALGQLEKMIGRQLDFFERVRSALIYPAILLLMVAVTLILVVTMVLPQFSPLFEGAEDRLPWITSAVMGVGEYIREYGFYLILIVIIFIVILAHQLKKSEIRKYIGMSIVRRRLGQKLFITLDIIRVARTLGSAIDGGVKLDIALPMATATVHNPFIREELVELTAAVKKGAFLSAELQSKEWVPSLLLQMVRVGEETGQLGAMLQESAMLMEENYQITLERFLGLLSPLLTLVMGGIVATLIGAVLIGMMSINDVAF